VLPDGALSGYCGGTGSRRRRGYAMRGATAVRRAQRSLGIPARMSAVARACELSVANRLTTFRLHWSGATALPDLLSVGCGGSITHLRRGRVLRRCPTTQRQGGGPRWRAGLEPRNPRHPDCLRQFQPHHTSRSKPTERRGRVPGQAPCSSLAQCVLPESSVSSGPRRQTCVQARNP
jgi:hypothetical protein